MSSWMKHLRATGLAGWLLAAIACTLAPSFSAWAVNPYCQALLTELKPGAGIREATADDVGALQAFVRKSQREFGRREVPDAPDVADFAANYADGRGRFLIVTNVEGKIIGTAAIAPSGREGVGEVRHLFLANELRGKGLGKALVEELMSQARELGFKRLELDISPRMKIAEATFRSVGFRPATGETFALDLVITSTAERVAAREAKVKFFNDVADAIEARRDRVKRILMQVDNASGAEYELRQALDTLRGAGRIEIDNLQNTRRLKNVAVYGSTNIPLYTLILHGLLPLSVSEQVWFRTPAASRRVYAELFAELSDALPPGSLEGLHVLTEAKDVQYDNFRKHYVLGLNRKGTRFERAPAEVVLFTGSPETARKVLDQNAEKMAETQGRSEPYDQVFLAFGAGMNPMVVTGEARANLDAAIHATLDSIRVNCGQDCIAPNFYLVQKNVAEPYIDGLLAETSKIAPGELTLSEDVKQLQSYRDTWKDYLVNKDATIDAAHKLVSPHVFVFPMSMFKDVGLQEHYGPFITIFTYDGPSELAAAARDERVQRKAMYATVFGEKPEGFEVRQARAIFEQHRHSVSVNASMYADESGNVAFGGQGSDSSIVAHIIVPTGGSPSVTVTHRPILFSAEARSAFGKAAP